MLGRSTIVMLALAAMPAIATAQQDTSRTGQQRDSTYGNQRDQGNRNARGQHTSRTRTSGGDVEMRGAAYGRGSLGLNSDQITELQQALRDAGCDPGPVDGKLGPRTRRAMACARQQNSLSGNNANELFRSLNLSFTASDSMGMGGAMRRGGNRRGQNPTQDNQGRIRPPADSANNDSTNNARSPRDAQRGRGMHDSTTARPDSTRTP